MSKYKTNINTLISGVETIGKLSIQELRHSLYKIKWQKSFPDPFKLVRIEPSKVNYRLCRPNNISRYGVYIRDGDWDKHYYREDDHIWRASPIPQKKTFSKPTQIKFEKFGMYCSLKKHFQDGIPWSETTYYKKLKSALNEKQPVRPTGRPDDYFERIDSLYDSIKKNGYRSQKELLNDSSTRAQKTRIIMPVLNEICISIGRDGKMMHDGGGEHRLCIAKILGLDKVPVRIIVRHKKWQIFRKKLVGSNENEISYQKHPDLQDIIG